MSTEAAILACRTGEKAYPTLRRSDSKTNVIKAQNVKPVCPISCGCCGCPGGGLRGVVFISEDMQNAPIGVLFGIFLFFSLIVCSGIMVYLRGGNSHSLTHSLTKLYHTTQRLYTEMKFNLCTWFGEISSCSCLTVLPGPAWVLLNKICKE